MAETFNVVVEIPRGSKNKYEVDHGFRPRVPGPHAVHRDGLSG